jgi:HAD superfamily hydrolase (TIGR01509 family)
MSLKAIIFDMDGVLVMSNKYNWQSFRTVWKKHGIELPVANNEHRKKYLGRSLKDQIALVKEEYGFKGKLDVDAFSKEALEIQLEIMKHELVRNEDALKLIKIAKKNKIKVAVATSSTKVRTEKMLELLGISDELDVLVTAEDVHAHKPFPDVYLETAKLLDVNPSECIVIEDALNGILSAKSAGMKVIGFRNVYVDEETMLKAGADRIIKSISELKLKDLEKMFKLK